LVPAQIVCAQSAPVHRTAIIKAPGALPSIDNRRDQLDRARRQAELKNELIRQRKMSGRLSKMGAFIPDDGGAVMLTNRTYKYRQRNDYIEDKIKFDPIVVPDRYLKPPVRYTDSQIHELVRLYCNKYGLDESLVHAMIRVESAGNPNAVSNKGASGLMQLMPGTAKDMGVRNIFDPAENIAGGTQFFAKVLDVFEGNVSLALAGYNAGPENVKKYGGIPPFKETQNYVRDVLRRWQEYAGNGNSIQYPKVLPHAETPKLLAKNEPQTVATVKMPEPAPTGKAKVHFKSGAIQEADRVVTEGDYYYIEAGGRNLRIHKDQIDNVHGAEDAKLAAKM
jgi:soluble lytic murein transglycosylase-like protein